MLYYTVDKSPEKDGVYVCKMGNDEDTILQWYGDHWEKINTGTLVLEPVKGWIGPLQRERYLHLQYSGSVKLIEEP